jgi:hypothetical protein
MDHSWKQSKVNGENARFRRCFVAPRGPAGGCEKAEKLVNLGVLFRLLMEQG